jgi:hypothetical protein
MAITVSANGGGDYTPAPAGVHQAVCCDVVDLGLVETEWQGQRKTAHKVRLVWQIDALMNDGRPYTVSSRYTASLHEKSRLRADLQSWRGRPFTAEELAAFDLEKLLGAGCLLNVVHTARNGKSYADIVAIMPLPKQTPKLAVSPDYVRQQDRQQDGRGGGRQADSYAPAQSVGHQLAAQVDEVSVDDIPF